MVHVNDDPGRGPCVVAPIVSVESNSRCLSCSMSHLKAQHSLLSFASACIHLSMHAEWKMCPQTRTSNLASGVSKFYMHMLQYVRQCSSRFGSADIISAMLVGLGIISCVSAAVPSSEPEAAFSGTGIASLVRGTTVNGRVF